MHASRDPREISQRRFSLSGKRAASLALMMLALAVVSVLGALSGGAQHSAPSGAANTAAPAAEPDVNKLPLAFEPNAGQSDSEVRYLAHQRGGIVYFGDDELVLAPAGPAPALGADSRNSPLPSAGDSLGAPGIPAAEQASALVPMTASTTSGVRLRFVQARPDARIQAGAPLPGKVNYIKGNDPSKWQTNLSTYTSITYTNIYTGVDVAYSGDSKQLAGSYSLAAGVDPSTLRWHVEGGDARVDTSGNLLLESNSPSAATQDRKPVLVARAPSGYQDAPNGKVRLSARYVVNEDGTASVQATGVDPSLPLHLDAPMAFVGAPAATGSDITSALPADASHRTDILPQGRTGPSTAAKSATAVSVPSGPKSGAPQVILTPRVLGPFTQATSPKLRDLAPSLAVQRDGTEKEVENGRGILPLNAGHIADTVVQRVFGALAIPTPVSSFDGVPSLNGSSPPDVTGDIGPLYYVESVNTSMAIFKRDGTQIYPSLPTRGADERVLWAAANPLGPCAQGNFGDGLVQYDQMADRWVLSHFARITSPTGGYPAGFYQCSAVSTTPDPTDSWYVSDAFLSATELNDYPKMGIWPDAYYLTTDRYAGDFRTGPAAIAFDRASMLAGQAYNGVEFDLDRDNGLMLPADMEGEMQPPNNSPGVFAAMTGTNTLDLWHLYPNFMNPGASFLVGPDTLITAPYDTNMCGREPSCIAQPGITQTLDVLSDRLMYRLSYRNLGDHESLLVNQSVDADGTDHAGVRWYEIRDPNGSPMVWQQGTYAPDANNRWMGSMAMDHVGNIALGYSIASGSMVPSIAYTGRLVTDTLGTMGAETILQTGTGVQMPGSNRWGDYTTMSVDPTDDCTFWYVNQYFAHSSIAGWRTRVGSFKFPSCGASFSSYMGGSSEEDGGAQTVTDSQGNFYFSGLTLSTNYTITNFFQPINMGGYDAFVTKLKVTQSGPQVIYSTYLGGSGDDTGVGIAADSQGNTYLGGQTASYDFPAIDPITTTIGSTAAYVTKFGPNGGPPLYSTLISGDSFDRAQRLVADNQGNVYIGGLTASSNFITTTNAFQGSFGGNYDLFFAKVDTSQTGPDSLIYSTYLGGSDYDWIYGFTTDSAGNFYFSGKTNSRDFPLQSPIQPVYGGGPLDGFVGKLKADVSGLVYSTFFGGSGQDSLGELALDNEGNLYLNAFTSSPNYPLTRPLQSQLKGTYDAAVLKLNPSGTGVVFSTYLGGSGDEIGRGLAVDSSKNVYLTGLTNSTDFYTTTTGIQYQNHGDYDAFVTRLSPDGAEVTYSTYLGGGRGGQTDSDREDYGNTVTLDGQGNAYVVGQTYVKDFPVADALQRENAGDADLFVTKLQFDAATGPYPVCTPGPDYVITRGSDNIEVLNKSFIPGTDCDDCAVQINLPFSFRFYDLTTSSLYLDSNGTAQIVSSFTDGNNTCLINNSFNYALFPYWDQLDMSPQGCGPDCGIYAELTGTAPNRTLALEWRACQGHGVAGNCLGNRQVDFEIRLHEGQDTFDFVYLLTSDGGESATIGVQRGLGSRYTQLSCDPRNPVIDLGTRLTFSLQPCVAPPPTNTPTITKTITPTGTNTRTPTKTSTATRTNTPTITPTFTSTFTPVCGPQWLVVNSPNPYSVKDEYRDVAALSPTDIWAVGYGDLLSTVRHGIISRWDGTGWTNLAIPTAPDEQDEQLNGISALSSSDIWAVGYYEDSTSTHRTLVLHWNGSAWSVVPSPNPGALATELNRVVAISANDVWAVGFSNSGPNQGTGRHTLAMHWNGSAWSVATTANPDATDNILMDVDAAASNDVWAVGYGPNGTITMRWNGTQWNLIPSPRFGTNYTTLNAVAAISSNDVWAVGNYDNFVNARTFAIHWNGTQWTSATIPSVGASTDNLYGLSALSTGDVWAVGTTGPGALVERWDGTAWNVVNSPVTTNYSTLYGVAHLSAQEAWTVGSTSGVNTNRTLVERYTDPCAPATSTPTGTPPTVTPTATAPYGWFNVSAPNPGAVNNGVFAMYGTSAQDIWAVGSSSSGIDRTMILHWDGVAWSTVASPNLGTSRNYLYGVTAISPNDAWAVGYATNNNVWQTLTLHWNGTAWSIVPSPNAGTNLNNFLNAVSASAANDVWAVGYYMPNGDMSLTMHWDGSAWTIVDSPNADTTINILNGVASVSANDAWAVGQASNKSWSMHWNGTAWNIVAVPNPTALGTLKAVTALSASDVWAVGIDNHQSTTGPLSIHWDGTQWITVSDTLPGGANSAYWQGISAVAPNDIWAVGLVSFGSSGTLIGHWNGTTWRVVDSPNPGTTNQFFAAYAVNGSDAWAAGTTGSSNLLAHYVNAYPTATLSPTQTRTRTATGTPTNTPTRTNTPTVTLTRTVTETPTQVPVCGPGANFIVTQSTGATVVPGTSLVPGSQCQGCSNRIDLPFTYNFYGQNFNSVSVWGAGALNFVNDTPVNTNTCLPNQSTNYGIMAYWDNLDLRTSVSNTLGIFTSTSGVAPNRIFNVEWRACLYVGSSCGGNVNFEVRLYESQTRFDVVYGSTLAGNGTGATVGVERGPGQFTQFSCNTASLQPGLLLAFAQAGCLTSTPTTTPTVTNTATATDTQTPTSSPTITLTPTITPSPTSTRTNTPTVVLTPTSTNTPTNTITLTPTITRTPTRTATLCPTCPTNTRTRTATRTGTPTATQPTSTTTGTPTSTRTITRTPTVTPTVAVCGDGSNYLVTQVSGGGGFVPGVQLVPNSQCYACTVNISLPFSYDFYGVPYDHVIAGSHGALDFIANGNPDQNTCLPDSRYFSNAIFAHWDDIETSSGGCPDCGIYISLTGQAPNRQFNIEWRAVLLSTNGDVNFEVRLYEGQDRFDILYSTVSGGGQSATIGAERNGGVQYTQFSCNTSGITSGTQLIFTQPACATATATATLCAGCPTWTVTPTATATSAPTCVGTDYQVTPSTGAAIVPGTVNVDLQCNSCAAPIQLPFTYYLYGEPHDSLFATAHGTLQFSDTFNNSYNNACLPYPFFSNTIAAFWDQMDLMQLNEGIFTSISGAAPNRIFNIEWRGCLAYPNPGAQCNGSVNFEVRLYEGQEKFDIVYGSTSNGGSSATVGVQHDNGTAFTEYECSTGGLSSGLRLTFVSGPCVVRTATATRTATLTPTSTRTFTATPTAIMIGHVTWQGRPAQPQSLQQLPITLTLKSDAGQADYDAVTTDASGFFTVSLGTLPQGTYGWRVKGPKFLANSGTVALSGSRVNNLEMGLMRGGDANNDNRITSVDFSIVRSSFGMSGSDPAYDDRADFTGDHVVNTSDFNLMRGNFGLGGAPPLARTGAAATGYVFHTGEETR